MDSGVVATAVLEQKLDLLNGLMSEMKEMVQSVDARVQALERREAGCQAVSQVQMAAAFRRLDEHAQRVKALEDVVQRLSVAYGAIVFLGSAFGLSMLALIWSLITGQATVTFK